MAIYRLPPSPFIGGRQPLDNRDLNPAFEAVEVNDPFPYSRPVIALWWQPEVIVRQRQIFVPQVAEEFVPFSRPYVHQDTGYYYPSFRAKGLIESVDNPPILNRPLIELRAWNVDAIPQQRQIKYPQEFIVAEEKVPYRSYISVILTNWSETVWLIQTPTHLPTDLPAVEDFVGQGRPQLQVLFEYLPLPQTGARIAALIPEAPVNDPPFSSRDFRVINIWNIPPDPYIYKFIKYPVEPDVVNDPPFGRRVLWLNTVLDAWIPPPPMPTNPFMEFTPPASDDIIIWMWKRVL